MELIDRACDDVETEIENIRNIFDHNCFDIKHLVILPLIQMDKI
jgi:hypothetical protein